MGTRQVITTQLYRDTAKRLRLLSVANDETIADVVERIVVPALDRLERESGMRFVGPDRTIARPSRAGKAGKAAGA
jgi:hypothetical protein